MNKYADYSTYHGTGADNTKGSIYTSTQLRGKKSKNVVNERGNILHGINKGLNKIGKISEYFRGLNIG